MTAPVATIFLPSHNKKDYVLDAIRSVLNQTFPYWEMWLLENSTDDGLTRGVLELSGVLDDPRIIYEKIDLDPDLRNSVHPTAWILNRYYPKANGNYIFYLSDDDLLEPDCFRTCVAHLNSHKHHHVVYFSLSVVEMPAPHTAGYQRGQIPATCIRGPGDVDGSIDGGQVAHRKSCLDALEQPFFNETTEKHYARHADGLFLQSLAIHYQFYPIRQVLSTKRYTPLSTWVAYINDMRIVR